MADDGFLSRWSRRKTQARTGVEAPEPVPAPPKQPELQPAEPAPPKAVETRAPAQPLAKPAPGTIAPAASEPDPAPPLPTLEDLAGLTHEADFRRFLAPGVDENVKRAALKTMFQAPHFNVMDGLDVYIDDYGKPDPIPPSMLRKLAQSRMLGLFDDEDERAAEAGHPAGDAPGAESGTAVAEAQPEASPDGCEAQDLPQSLPATPDPGLPDPMSAAADNAAVGRDEDADLQLQPDDAARRRGAA